MDQEALDISAEILSREPAERPDAATQAYNALLVKAKVLARRLEAIELENRHGK